MLAVDQPRPQRGAPALRGASATVLAQLRARARDGEAVITVGELAAAAGVAERTVQRAMNHLERAGVLRIVAARGQANRYVL